MSQDMNWDLVRSRLDPSLERVVDVVRSRDPSIGAMLNPFASAYFAGLIFFGHQSQAVLLGGPMKSSRWN